MLLPPHEFSDWWALLLRKDISQTNKHHLIILKLTVEIWQTINFLKENYVITSSISRKSIIIFFFSKSLEQNTNDFLRGCSCQKRELLRQV